MSDVVVLLDRGQGGRANVERRGKNLHSVITLSEALAVLYEKGLVRRNYSNCVRLAIHAIYIGACWGNLSEGSAPRFLLTSDSASVCSSFVLQGRRQSCCRRRRVPRCKPDDDSGRFASSLCCAEARESYRAYVRDSQCDCSKPRRESFV